VSIFAGASDSELQMRFVACHLANLRQMYNHQLRLLYFAESQISQVMPRMISESREPDLKRVLDGHLEQTRLHLARLTQILDADSALIQSENRVMAALIQECEAALASATEEPVRDAIIIAAAQKLEHYQIAAYGTLRNFAEILGNLEQAELLDQALDDEKLTDSLLTEIADSANTRADRTD